MLNREAFFKALSGSPFHSLEQHHQRLGTNALLDQWYLTNHKGDLRWLAYALATAFHETSHTMMPVEEWGHGHGHPYGAVNPHTGHAYYGRGYVQLTWIQNYARMSTVAGVDLVHHPEKALEPEIAAKIMFHGMEHGDFTGRKLGDYFNDRSTDWVNARRIINGLDRAELIAWYGKHLYTALHGATESDIPAPMKHG